MQFKLGGFTNLICINFRSRSSHHRFYLSRIFWHVHCHFLRNIIHNTNFSFPEEKKTYSVIYSISVRNDIKYKQITDPLNFKSPP